MHIDGEAHETADSIAGLATDRLELGTESILHAAAREVVGNATIANVTASRHELKLAALRWPRRPSTNADNTLLPPDHSQIAVAPPDLPELESLPLDSGLSDGRLLLDGAHVEHQDGQAVRARGIRVSESSLFGVTFEGGNAPGLALSDVVLRNCDLSNVDGREGSLRRVEIHGCRLVGFALAGGDIQDVRVVESSLALSSLAFSRLRNVVFARVDLTEASFMEARLDGVEFLDCKLAGADFRGAKLNACAIRGTSLDGILGVDCLRGVVMPWGDVLASAAALAAALGIVVEPE